MSTLAQPIYEILNQNIEVLQEIVDQNKAVLEINKQMLALLHNPMIQCSMTNEEKDS